MRENRCAVVDIDHTSKKPPGEQQFDADRWRQELRRVLRQFAERTAKLPGLARS